jgi:hypothetical protein
MRSKVIGLENACGQSADQRSTKGFCMLTPFVPDSHSLSPLGDLDTLDEPPVDPEVTMSNEKEIMVKQGQEGPHLSLSCCLSVRAIIDAVFHDAGGPRADQRLTKGVGSPGTLGLRGFWVSKDLESPEIARCDGSLSNFMLLIDDLMLMIDD